MINIKRFVDKVTAVGSKRKDVILSMEEALSLKDEITQLLADLHTLNSITFDKYKSTVESVKVEVNGGRWSS